MVAVHPTAIVAEGARIGEGTEVGPYSVIGAGVVLGRENVVGPHVVLDGNTVFGDGNHIFQFASIGAPPQDLKFGGEQSELIIGDRNVIREYVTLQPGTAHGRMKTVIGSDNLFMACSHVAHDVTVGNHNVFANGASLAGHVDVGSSVVLGGLAGVHQFVRLGDYSFLGAGSMVNKDVPPYCMAQGDRARLVGINRIGLERAGFSPDEIRLVKKAYRIIFHSSGAFDEGMQRALALETELSVEKEWKTLQHLLDFLASRKPRGVTMPRKRKDDHEVTDTDE